MSVMLTLFVLVCWYQYWSALVLYKEHKEFRGFGLARIPPNDMYIIGAFVEGLTRCQSHLLSASNLHHDRAFQDVNETVRIVAMYWIRTTWRIYNGNHQALFASYANKVLRHEPRYLSLLCYQRARQKASQPQDEFGEFHKSTSRMSGVVSIRRSVLAETSASCAEPADFHLGSRRPFRAMAVPSLTRLVQTESKSRILLSGRPFASAVRTRLDRLPQRFVT
jgi:hypothetical protein